MSQQLIVSEIESEIDRKSETSGYKSKKNIYDSLKKVSSQQNEREMVKWVEGKSQIYSKSFKRTSICKAKM